MYVKVLYRAIGIEIHFTYGFLFAIILTLIEACKAFYFD